MNRRFHPVTLQEATQAAPTLARLTQLAQQSRHWLALVEPLIPPPLRPGVRAGAVDGAAWCLMVDNNAAAAKLRQLLPTLLARLQQQGCEVNSIRLKISQPGK